MIYIEDDFLPNNLFEELLNHSSNFNKIDTPGKSFWVKETPEKIQSFILKKLEKIEGKKINNILSFIREAKLNQDDDWRIHNDSIIENQKPERAVVFYIKSEDSGLSGTSFWSHKKYGDVFPNDLNEDEFNRLLTEDSNNSELWDLKSVIGFKENRLLSYPCNYFHSKFPNRFIKPRIVLVMFYNFDNE
jgi:hypothetical protein